MWLPSEVAEATFDRSSPISTIITGRSNFKGWYLKQEIYSYIEATGKFRIQCDAIDWLKNGHIHTINMHSQTYSNDNNIVIYHFKSIVRLILWGSKLSCFSLKVSMAQELWSWMQLKEVALCCWINKTIAICSNILVIIYMLCMHYEFQRMGLLFGVYLTFKLLKYYKVYIPVLFLNMHLIFC